MRTIRINRSYHNWRWSWRDYRCSEQSKIRKQRRVTPINDQLNDGLTIQAFVRADNDINVNDTLQIELDAIDKPLYDYWYTLNSTTLSSQTAAPANPPSNISNGALGYFSAYAATLSHHVVIDHTGFHRID